MRKFIGWMGVVAVAFSLAVSANAADKPEGKKKADPEVAFKKMDTNSDGKISLEEFTGKKTGEMAEKAKALFAKVDKDSDGGITLDEFKNRGKKAPK